MDMETHQLMEEFDKLVEEKADKDKRMAQLIRDIGSFYREPGAAKNMMRLMIESYREELEDEEQFIMEMRKLLEEKEE